MTAPLLVVPVYHPDHVEHRRQLAQGVNAALNEQGLPARYRLLTPALVRDGATPALATLSGAVKVWAVADAEALHFTALIDHGLIEGEAVVPHVRWCPLDGSGGTVGWALDYCLAAPAGTFGAATTVSVSVSATTALTHSVATLSAITVTTISTAIVGRLRRNGGSHVPAAGLLALDFLLPVDAKGSQDAFTKYVGA